LKLFTVKTKIKLYYRKIVIYPKMGPLDLGPLSRFWTPKKYSSGTPKKRENMKNNRTAISVM
jgi:hypothetical protein